MKKEIIEIKYGELRKLTEKLIAIISEETRLPINKISLKTSINNQLGIEGDDWFLIQDRIQAEFNFDFKGFNFNEYFYEEGENVLFLPFIIFSSLFNIIEYILIFPFNRIKAKEVWNNKLFKNKPDLKIEDLITSILKNEFLNKEEFEFRLI